MAAALLASLPHFASICSRRRPHLPGDSERLGARFEEDYTWLGRKTGWQNLEMITQYLAILDPPHEALVTLGVDREWGGTGTRRHRHAAGSGLA
jgi:hypothetical protein